MDRAAKEARNRYMREYRSKNKEKLSIQAKKRREADPERFKQYRADYWKRKAEKAVEIKPKFVEWIPVSEKLPERNETVLVCAMDQDVFCALHEGELFSSEFGDFSISKDEYEEGIYYFEGYIIAWMPLPEPYKEGGSNG